jgi:Holliday junction DNA helicase RuvB
VETAADAPQEYTESPLRPRSFRDYPGQERIIENLKVAVEASRRLNKPLNHILLHGPPGLGKTTLARIVANELGVPFHHSSGPILDKPGDLAGILAGIEERSILFIDEIHRLPITVEEVLYTAMEDFNMDIIVGQGPTARTVRMPLAPFTLIGATTRAALLSRPLISRFIIEERLEFYSDESLARIVGAAGKVLEMTLSPDGSLELARRARGTPRIALRLLQRVRDFAVVDDRKVIDREFVGAALTRLDIDPRGLDWMDRLILKTIVERYEGGPVGLDTLAATIGEERTTVEDVYEPFLVHQGFITRGPRGRSITPQGRAHLGS